MAETIERLNENTKSFSAGGKKYLVHDSLTADGFQQLEEFRVEIECGNSTADLQKNLQASYALLNQGKMADASVKLYNSINITERVIDGRRPAWLLALTLFIRPEGANLNEWSEPEAESWIKDWTEAGYAIDDLFTIAYACQKKLDSGFLRHFPDISETPGENAADVGDQQKQKQEAN